MGSTTFKYCVDDMLILVAAITFFEDTLYTQLQQIVEKYAQ